MKWELASCFRESASSRRALETPHSPASVSSCCLCMLASACELIRANGNELWAPGYDSRATLLDLLKNPGFHLKTKFHGHLRRFSSISWSGSSRGFSHLAEGPAARAKAASYLGRLISNCSHGSACTQPLGHEVSTVSRAPSELKARDWKLRRTYSSLVADTRAVRHT